MSTENLALIRRFTESWTQGDLDAALDCIDAEIEFDWSASMGPFQGTYEGPQGIRRFWSEMLDAWDRFELDVEEAVDCGPDRLVTVILARGKGAGSGIEIEARAAMLWVVRSGKIRKGELFQTRDEALSEAATQA